MPTLTVAIVEDREEIRVSLRRLIGGTDGYAVTGAYSSMEEAIPGVASTMPDAMIIDIGLPGMSGIEGIRRLRARYPRLAMMVLTVFDDDSRIFEAICAGAQGYLLKNTPPERLVASIGEMLDGGSPMSPGIARRVIELFRHFRPPEAAPQSLTPHEIRVLKLISDGHNVRTAAKELGVSPNTVSFHLKAIYGKLEVHSKAEAVAKALRQGVLR